VAAPRSPLVPALSFLGVALLVAGVVVYLRVSDATDQDARRAADARHATEQRAQAERLIGRVREESTALIPPMLRGVQLGMSERELVAVRPAAAPDPRNRDAELLFRTEDLPNGASVVYGLDRRSLRVVQLQVLSLLPSADALGPHLISMNETYGRPTGYWDCPDTGGVPTRRFTWRKSTLTVMDVFLIYRGRVSLTLYLAPTESIGRSLQRSQCRPVPAAELDRFPAATDEQMALPVHGAQQPPEPPHLR
jgi:hypothetical protein